MGDAFDYQHEQEWRPAPPIVATRACWTCYAVCGEDHAPGCDTAIAIREQYASLPSMNTHSSPGERPVIGLLSTVPGAQSHTRTRSLVTMKKEELIERVLVVEEHCRLIDARLHEAWREVNTLRALRDSIKVIDLGPLAPSEREELEDLRFRMKGLEK